MQNILHQTFFIGRYNNAFVHLNALQLTALDSQGLQ